MTYVMVTCDNAFKCLAKHWLYKPVSVIIITVIFPNGQAICCVTLPPMQNQMPRRIQMNSRTTSYPDLKKKKLTKTVFI